MTRYYLEKFIAERLRWRLHPLLIGEATVRHFPPITRKLMIYYEPAHMIVLAKENCWVDGLIKPSTISLKAKLCAAIKAVRTVYGPLTPRKTECDKITNIPCKIWMCEKPLPQEHFGTNTCWPVQTYPMIIEYEDRGIPEVSSTPFRYLLVLFPNDFARVAFKTGGSYERMVKTALPKAFYAPEQGVDETVFLATFARGAIACSDVGVSTTFFYNPKIENVRYFGDLCFLSQALENWKLETEVLSFAKGRRDVDFQDRLSTFNIARELSKTIGFKSLAQTVYIQLLIKENNAEDLWFWRLIAENVKKIEEKRATPF